MKEVSPVCAHQVYILPVQPFCQKQPKVVSFSLLYSSQIYCEAMLWRLWLGVKVLWLQELSLLNHHLRTG